MFIKIVRLFLIGLIFSHFTTTHAMNMNQTNNLGMYMDFGMGVGEAAGWSKKSLALDAMTMGMYMYMKKNLALELGMGMLTEGTYKYHDARVNNFHFAGKARLPLTNLFSVYGKLGVGISLGQGHVSNTPTAVAMPIMTTYVGPYYGGGVQFKLSNHLALYVEDSGIVVVQQHQEFGSVNQVTLGIELYM